MKISKMLIFLFFSFILINNTKPAEVATKVVPDVLSNYLTDIVKCINHRLSSSNLEKEIADRKLHIDSLEALVEKRIGEDALKVKKVAILARIVNDTYISRFYEIPQVSWLLGKIAIHNSDDPNNTQIDAVQRFFEQHLKKIFEQLSDLHKQFFIQAIYYILLLEVLVDTNSNNHTTLSTDEAKSMISKDADDGIDFLKDVF